jgi:hypothetical protein
MKKLTALLFFVFASVAFTNAQTWVNGFYKPTTNTYVDGYYRSTSNQTNWDNWSTSGNSNPYTGTSGYRARDYSSDTWNSGTNKAIYTGPNGGQYYINSNGNRTYVPKR